MTYIDFLFPWFSLYLYGSCAKIQYFSERSEILYIYIYLSRLIPDQLVLSVSSFWSRSNKYQELLGGYWWDNEKEQYLWLKIFLMFLKLFFDEFQYHFVSRIAFYLGKDDHRNNQRQEKKSNEELFSFF